MGVPYASANSRSSARDEITKILRRFGCESVGFMDDFEKHEVLLGCLAPGSCGGQLDSTRLDQRTGDRCRMRDFVI